MKSMPAERMEPRYVRVCMRPPPSYSPNTRVSRGQGAGPCAHRSNPDECKGGALPALLTSSYPVRL